MPTEGARSGLLHAASTRVMDLTTMTRRWGGNVVWTIADQGFFATSNFLLNVLLARWLVAEAYGAFTVAFTVFLLVGTFHTAILTEPMLVYGSGRHRSRFAAYWRTLGTLHWSYTVAVGGVIALVGAGLWAVGRTGSGATIVALGVATPVLLAQWLWRRATYVVMRPRLAAVAGLLYAAAVLGLTVLLRSRGQLSAPGAILIMALASLAAVAFLGPALGRASRNGGRPAGSTLPVRAVAREHWSYGRWSVGTALLTWLPGNIYFLLLPVWAGLAASGALRAVLNLYLPVMHVTTALGILLLPVLVSQRSETDFRSVVRRLAWALMALPVLYWLGLVWAGDEVLAWMYDGQYVEYGPLLPLLGLLPVAAGAVAVLGAALRAIERPDEVFRAYLAGTFAALSVGLLLALRWGVAGAASGWMLSYALTAVVMAMRFHRVSPTRRGSPVGVPIVSAS